MKQAIFRMKSEDVAEVLLYGILGSDFFGDGITAKDFRAQIKQVKASTLNLRINSPGGDVLEGAAMMAALDEFKGTIEVDIDGLAASAASVVAMAGDTIRMASNALLMIHNPMTITVGGAEEHRGTAEVLDKVKGQIIASYQRHSKESEKQLSAWMDSETWFTAAEAIQAGLADSENEPVRVAALADGAQFFGRLKFRHAPAFAQVAQEQAWEETRKRMAIAASL